MSPFFIGLAAAEFLPADPAVWIDAAAAARMRFGRYMCRGENRPRVRVMPDKDDRETPEQKATRDFLTGWLLATPGGEEAVHDWLKVRNYVAITPSGPLCPEDIPGWREH